MVRVKNIVISGNQAEVTLFADTKSEVLNDVSSMTIVGLPAGIEIMPGSEVYTASLDVGVRTSNDTWNWG